MSRNQLNIEIDRYLKEKFRVICDREGETMSKKVRKWVIQYILEHEKGNPQTLLQSDPSLLEIMLEGQDKVFFQRSPEGRKRRIELLKLNLDRFPGHAREVGFAFMRESGLSARTVEEYFQSLGKPVLLTRRKARRRNY